MRDGGTLTLPVSAALEQGEGWGTCSPTPLKCTTRSRLRRCLLLSALSLPAPLCPPPLPLPPPTTTTAAAAAFGQATKHHPSSVDLELIKRLAGATACTTLAAFLSKEFDCISRTLAGAAVGGPVVFGWVPRAPAPCSASLRPLLLPLQLLPPPPPPPPLTAAEKISLEMRCDPSHPPADLTTKDIVAMHDLLHQLRFQNPDGAHLSPAGARPAPLPLPLPLPLTETVLNQAAPLPPPAPAPATAPPAGEYNLRLGVMKELRPEMVATHQGSIGVHEGHAFVVEAAVSVGGKNIKPGLNIHRFANRIPLLFEVRCGAG